MAKTSGTREFVPFLKRPFSFTQDSPQKLRDVLSKNFPNEPYLVDFMGYGSVPLILFNFEEAIRNYPIDMSKFFLKIFFKEIFDRDIFKKGMHFPCFPGYEGFRNYMVTLKDLEPRELIQVCEKFSIVEFHMNIETVETLIGKEKKDIWFTHRGHRNHDYEWDNISFTKLMTRNGSFMTLGQYLLTRLFYYWLTGKNFDNETATVLVSAVDGKAVQVLPNTFKKCSIVAGDKNTDYGIGAREVIYF